MYAVLNLNRQYVTKSFEIQATSRHWAMQNTVFFEIEKNFEIWQMINLKSEF